MGDFDFWRWVRIMAVAVVAAYVLHILGAVVQVFAGDSAFTNGTALRFNLLSLGTAANGVSELLLVAGLAMSWGEPDRRLLGVICGAGAVSVLMAAIGVVDMATWPYSQAPQRWFDAGAMTGGIIVAAVVTLAAWRWFTSLSGSGPAAADEPGDYVSEPLESPSPGPDSR